MNANGIEKITGRILDDARENTRAILDDAKTRSDEILNRYKKRAEEASKNAEKAALTESATIIERAETAGNTTLRNAVLEAKNMLIDEAFDGALEVFLKLPRDEYAALMTGLLSSSLSERNTAGTDESIEEYQIIFNSSDRDSVALAVVNGVKDGKKITVSDKTADIAGGFILVCGDIEINCSLRLIADRLRAGLEAGICKVLFTDVPSESRKDRA